MIDEESFSKAAAALYFEATGADAPSGPISSEDGSEILKQICALLTEVV